VEHSAHQMGLKLVRRGWGKARRCGQKKEDEEGPHYLSKKPLRRSPKVPKLSGALFSLR
jgi:hypothetical protein